MRDEGELNVNRKVCLISSNQNVWQVGKTTDTAHSPIIDPQKGLPTYGLLCVDYCQHTDQPLAALAHAILPQLHGDSCGRQPMRDLPDLDVDTVAKDTVLQQVDDWLEKRRRGDGRSWPWAYYA